MDVAKACALRGKEIKILPRVAMVRMEELSPHEVMSLLHSFSSFSLSEKCIRMFDLKSRSILQDRTFTFKERAHFMAYLLAHGPPLT